MDLLCVALYVWGFTTKTSQKLRVFFKQDNLLNGTAVLWYLVLWYEYDVAFFMWSS